MADKIVLEIARYSPERDTEPHYESYEVPVHKEWVVLDALNHIKDTVDGTLTYRWSCRMGICGTCTTRKRTGSVRNILTGAISSASDERVRLCVSVPIGDVALDL